MRGDVEVPVRPPKKRRALERALDRHLAIWAADESLSEVDRERVREERERRKRARPAMVVGVLVGAGGATPEQIMALDYALRSKLPTEVHHPFCPSRVHTVCRACGAKVVAMRGDPELAARAIAQASSEVIGLVNESSMPHVKVGVWSWLRLAKDRGTDVTVIWPDGNKLTERW